MSTDLQDRGQHTNAGQLQDSEKRVMPLCKQCLIASLTSTLTLTLIIVFHVQTLTLGHDKTSKNMNGFAELGPWLDHYLMTGRREPGNADICC